MVYGAGKKPDAPTTSMLIFRMKPGPAGTLLCHARITCKNERPERWFGRER